MADRRTRPFRKVRRKYTFIILAILSGIIGSIWIAIDRYTGSAIVVNSLGETNEYVFTIQSMIIGIIVSFLFALILWIPISKKPFTKLTEKLKKRKTSDSNQLKESQPEKEEKRKFSFLGQFIDPQYKGIRLPNKKMFLWLSLSGLLSGINTFSYFIIIKDMDLSIFLPASQFVIIYLIIGDLVVDRTRPCAPEIQSIIMIFLGVILAAIDFTSSGSFNWVNLILVFLVLNTSAAVYVIFQKKAVATKYKNGENLDSTNIRLWTLLFMAFFAIIFSLPFMDAEGFSVFRSTFLPALFPIALSMLLVFVARILYVRALSMGKMSIVTSLSSVSVIAGIPITVIFGFIWPAHFPLPGGEFAWVIWLLRGVGVILVFSGIIGLSMSEVKIMIFAKIKAGQLCDYEQIKAISGVEQVSVITGKYDIMITIRSRTIGRGYQPIVEKLAKMPCIDVIHSNTIMKEWHS
ncbi:MAG: Lrp/AsnC ligand binding domain-containing protein [Candidatus Heimdallarchaeota archaeon]|nr:Lrp/AsnC ligand binding domain-containing protein [Candidatus Heimdallarchaeota archaeon]MCK4289418.1 Lrp/AsnC ligand binding domain-containing protein [Candidatus Heimdallarchaeota archaeon]